MTKEELLVIAKRCADGGPCTACPFDDADDGSADCLTALMKELIVLAEGGELRVGR